jgi:hypothetical protein
MISLVRHRHFYADHRSANVRPGNSATPCLGVHEFKSAAPTWSLHTLAISCCRFHARRRLSCHAPWSLFPHSS